MSDAPSPSSERQFPPEPVIDPVTGEFEIVPDPTHLPTGELLIQWAPQPSPEVRARAFGGKALAAWALALAVVALIASLFTGWALALAIASVVVGIVAARRTVGRSIAAWAISLGMIAVIYSAGWLVWMFVLSAPAR